MRWGPILVVVFSLVVVPETDASTIVFDALNASLNTGSLAGTQFPVNFSYDDSQVLPVGDSYVSLITFDFTLLGVPFNRSETFQGGQAIFHDGVIKNVTASYQVILPPNSPVRNITFGFGSLGGIGYIDLSGNSGTGTFTFASQTVPEPCSTLLLALPILGILAGLLCQSR